MKRLIFVFSALFFIVLQQASAQRYLGGDISLWPTYDQAGTVYCNQQGRPTPLLTLCRQAGWNTMRVRLFVDPSMAPQENKDEGVCQNLPYVIGLCRQIKKAGFRLMLDIHYSDTWADPSKQFTPARWQQAIKAHPQADAARLLRDSVETYTTHVLQTLRKHNITPDLIQVGNEITFGMLWPTGRVELSKADNWNILAMLLQAGCKACRKQCPKAKIIIHTEHAYDTDATLYYYDKLKEYGVDYDIIGLSYYPMWHKDIKTLGRNLSVLAQHEPDKQVMIVETAFYYSHKNDKWEPDSTHYADLYPISTEGQRKFAHELVSELNRHPNVTGLFWWFPEENESGKTVIKSWINRGLFDNQTGYALPALKEMRRFVLKNKMN
jgi:arabinogalactan endo-1,4-beta-galactosidase